MAVLRRVVSQQIDGMRFGTFTPFSNITPSVVDVNARGTCRGHGNLLAQVEFDLSQTSYRLSKIVFMQVFCLKQVNRDL